MKLSRNVLVGSLAVTGMVLGAVAPAVTANAATGSAEFVNGTYTKKDTDVGALTKDGHDLAIAYDSMDSTNPETGTATGTSNANVNVISGILVLDARADKTTAATKGFQLTASVAPFVKASDTGTAIDKGDGFTLTLNPQAVLGGDGENASTSATDLTTDEKVAIPSTGTDTPVLTPVAGSYKVGALKAQFNTADAASLEIPSGVAGTDNSKPSTTSLQSEITWTLNAAAKATA